MLQNYNVDITDFIKITKGGIKIADFVQVREALITRYKSVYGSDIDLSTSSADGVFINNTALMINNILQSVKTLYANLDVNTANGVYLDNLCALSNITRKPATASTASLIVTNTNDAEFTANSLIFVDKAGTEWIYNQAVSIPANTSITLVVTCSQLGPVKAEAGWIDKTLEVTYLDVVQENAASEGENEESDAALRARRSQSSGAEGTTVLESLIGALLEIAGIRDVKIYNNNTTSATTAKDNTSIPAHSIYVVMRYLEGITIDDKLLGSLIYEKLTPGILTTQTGSSDADENGHYTYTPSALGLALTAFENEIYWKIAKPVHPTISIKLNTEAYFTDSEVTDIGNDLIEYLNNLPISTDLTAQNILIEVASADPLFLGRNTYTVAQVNINGATSGSYANPDTYYKYTNIAYESNTTTITIS